MKANLPVLASLAGAGVLFLAIAFVYVLVILGLVLDGVEFPGGPEIADAAALGRTLLAA